MDAFDAVAFVEGGRPQRQPLGLGLARKIVLAQVRAVVRPAILLADEHDPPAIPCLAQRGHRRPSGGSGADDREGPRVGAEVGRDHRHGPLPLGVVGHVDVHLAVGDADLELRQGRQCGRVEEASRDGVEHGLMPGAEDPAVVQQAFGERRLIVRAAGGVGVVLPADTQQQYLARAGLDLLHLAVVQTVGPGVVLHVVLSPLTPLSCT